MAEAPGINELVERAAKATGPDREIDALIYIALESPTRSPTPGRMRAMIEEAQAVIERLRRPGSGGMWGPPVTADAADVIEGLLALLRPPVSPEGEVERVARASTEALVEELAKAAAAAVQRLDRVELDEIYNGFSEENVIADKLVRAILARLAEIGPSEEMIAAAWNGRDSVAVFTAMLRALIR